MMFWIGLFVASIVYYFIWGNKKSSVRYTPNGNAYVTDGSGYIYPVTSKQQEQTDIPSNTGFSRLIKSILLIFCMAIALYVLLGDLPKELLENKYAVHLFQFLCLGFIVVVGYQLISWDKKIYLSMPTSKQYERDYPSCKTSDGFSCKSCGSRSIRNWGENNAKDSNRLFICNHCGTHLYRN